MSYDDWKLETPEDEAERFARRLYGRKAYWERDPDEARDAEQDRLADIREDCKADWQLYGEDE